MDTIFTQYTFQWGCSPMLELSTMGFKNMLCKCRGSSKYGLNSTTCPSIKDLMFHIYLFISLVRQDIGAHVIRGVEYTYFAIDKLGSLINTF